MGLTDDVIVREFNMGKQYMQDFKVWGDKVLVKETNSVAKKTRKLKILKIEWPSITNWQRRIMRLCTVLSRVVNIYKSCTYIIILHY